MTSALLGLALAWAATEPAVPVPPVPARWELTWQAPPTCPDPAAIRARVAALVPVLGEGDGVLYVHAAVEPRDGALVLVMRTDFAGRHDEREARAATCDELAEAVVLVVAVSLDPTLAVAPTRVPAPPSPKVGVPEPDALEPRPAALEPVAPLEPDALEPDALEPAPTAGRRSLGVDGAPRLRPSGWTLRLAPKLELGSLPAVTGGLELAAGLEWQRWRLELHGAHSWPRRAVGPGGSAGRFQLGAVGVRGCGRPRVGPVELPVCAGLEGGALRVDSEGLRPTTTVHGPWLVQSVGVGLAAGGPRVAFWTLVEGSATLVWSRILVGEATLFRPFPVSARWLAGLELRFAIESR